MYLHHTDKEKLQILLSPILNMHSLQDLKIMPHHTLQDIIDIINRAHGGQDFTRSHGEADVN